MTMRAGENQVGYLERITTVVPKSATTVGGDFSPRAYTQPVIQPDSKAHKVRNITGEMGWGVADLACVGWDFQKVRSLVHAASRCTCQGRRGWRRGVIEPLDFPRPV